MPDITMCNNSSCPIREKCYRFMAKPGPVWQSYCRFEYDNGCRYFWPIEEVKPTKNKKEKK